MRSLLLSLLVIVCLSTGANAHNPLTARFELDATAPQLTLLHVYVSQTGLHQALLKHYPGTDFTTISIPAYKQLAVTYVREHISLSADGAKLTLGEGGIKLGNHQTDFKFLVGNYTGQVATLRARIDAFADNDHHQSVFQWTRAGGSSKAVLSAENAYTETLTASPSSSSPTWLALGVGGVAVASLLLVVGFRHFPLKQ